MLGGLWAGCGNTNQVQQSSNQSAAADTAQQKSTSNQKADQKDEEQIKALKEKYGEQLRSRYQDQANEITTYYILAQRHFYNREYQNALSYIKKAENVRTNADVLALKGNIYYGLNNIDKFVGNWRKALEMDRNVPLPLSDSLIEALQEHDLINENLEPNF